MRFALVSRSRPRMEWNARVSVVRCGRCGRCAAVDDDGWRMNRIAIPKKFHHSFVGRRTDDRTNDSERTRRGRARPTPVDDAGRRRQKCEYSWRKSRVFLAIGECGERIGRRASTFTTTSREWLFTGCALLSFSSSRAVPKPVDAPRWRRARMETHARWDTYPSHR